MRQIEPSLGGNTPDTGLESMLLTLAIHLFSNDRPGVKLFGAITLARLNIEINEGFSVLTLLLKSALEAMAKAARL